MVVRDAPVISRVEHDVTPRRVEVVDVVDLTPRMRRVVLADPDADLVGVPVSGPTDHLKIFFPAAPGEEPVAPEIGPRGLVTPVAGGARPYREYTVRRHDGDRIAVDVFRHGAGLAGRWIEDPHGALWLLGPRSTSRVESRDWYLLGGDETALPAIARWLETLPPERTTAFVEVADAAEHDYLSHLPDADVRWLHRHDAGPGSTTLLPDAVVAFDPPAGDGFCWMGAEAGTLRPVRRHLRDVLPAAAVDLDGYWRRGVAGTGLG